MVTKPGQKESFWLALACEQTGLLGHRCKNENMGVKVRIKWRIPVFCRFCEIGIRPWNLPDTAGSSGTGRGLFAVGQGGTAAGFAVDCNPTLQHLEKEGGRTSQGAHLWALPLFSQAGPAWLSTQAFQLSGQAESKQKGDAPIPSPGSFRQGKITVPAVRKGPDVCSQSWTLPQQMTAPDSMGQILVRCSPYLYLQPPGAFLTAGSKLGVLQHNLYHTTAEPLGAGLEIS